jgi:hypothetical protein
MTVVNQLAFGKKKLCEISKNGKYIPLSKGTGEPHQCEEAKAAQVS